MVLLDTNVASELVKSPRDRSVEEWFGGIPSKQLHTSAITVAELFEGVHRLPDGSRKISLADAIDRILRVVFPGRVLPFSESAARVFARVGAMRRESGRPIEFADAQIAAIPLIAGAELATRNTPYFEGVGLKLTNPWNYGGVGFNV